VTKVEFNDTGTAARDVIVADNVVAGNGGNGIDARIPRPAGSRLPATWSGRTTGPGSDIVRPVPHR